MGSEVNRIRKVGEDVSPLMKSINAKSRHFPLDNPPEDDYTDLERSVITAMLKGKMVIETLPLQNESSLKLTVRLETLTKRIEPETENRDKTNRS